MSIPCFNNIVNNLDIKELMPAEISIKKLYETETTCTIPILIIISTGADPSQELQELAANSIGSDKYHQV